MTVSDKGGDFPPEWSDDLRMAALFSPFRERETNPADWDGKMRFWRAAILRQCRRRRTAIVPPASTLVSWFSRGGQLPRGLHTVLENLHREGAVRPVQEAGGGWVAWGWSLAQRLAGRPPDLSVDSVCVQRLQEVEADMLAHHEREVRQHHNTAALTEYSDLRHELRDLVADDLTFDLALQSLQRKGHILVTSHSGKRIVKFLDPSANASKQVSETELGILRLKKAVAKLEREKDVLMKGIKKCDEEARDHVRKKSRSSALGSLREKKRLGAALERRQRALDNVLSLVDKLDDAASARLVVDAYRAGVQALRYSGVNLDETQRVMEDVGDALSDADDVGEALASPLTPGGLEDSGADLDNLEDLEKELADLLASSGPAEHAAGRLGAGGRTSTPQRPGRSEGLEEALKRLEVEDHTLPAGDSADPRRTPKDARLTAS